MVGATFSKGRWLFDTLFPELRNGELNKRVVKIRSNVSLLLLKQRRKSGSKYLSKESDLSTIQEPQTDIIEAKHMKREGEFKILKRLYSVCIRNKKSKQTFFFTKVFLFQLWQLYAPACFMVNTKLYFSHSVLTTLFKSLWWSVLQCCISWSRKRLALLQYGQENVDLLGTLLRTRIILFLVRS